MTAVYLTYNYDKKGRIISVYSSTGGKAMEYSYSEEEGEDDTGGEWIMWNAGKLDNTSDAFFGERPIFGKDK